MAEEEIKMSLQYILSILIFRDEKNELGCTKNPNPNSIRKISTKPEPDLKSSTESEPKLIKYPNGFKILVSLEPKPNPT